MKQFCNLLFLAFFLLGSVTLASDVIMATTEDLKEFDNLIAKDPKAPTPPNGKPPQGQMPAPPKKPNGDSKDQKRENFEGTENQKGPHNNRKRGRPRNGGGRPPAGPDTRPPPGGGQPPPPPPN